VRPGRPPGTARQPQAADVDRFAGLKVANGFSSTRALPVRMHRAVALHRTAATRARARCDAALATAQTRAGDVTHATAGRGHTAIHSRRMDVDNASFCDARRDGA
jgi:hypothetical protein